MPYVITTTRLMAANASVTDKESVPVSRRAVATLEEAQAHVGEILVEHGERAGVAPRLPEPGGTLSPLPDGTVIEVEAVKWVDLAGRLAGEGEMWDDADRREILDAYNARQS